jgi:DNA-binding GntR family transcriptional regulator
MTSLRAEPGTEKSRRGKSPENSTHGELPGRTYDRLRDLIVRGRMQPGERIVEAEVALKFGVSRTPVREAMARLLHERYLVPLRDTRRTQLVVAPFTPGDVRELWGMIGALEGHALSSVAKLDADRRAQLADDLESINAELVAAGRSRPRDPDLLFELQTAFHLRFVNETGGPHFRDVYNALRPHVQRYEWIYGTRSDAKYEPSTREHAGIISAIRAGDGKTAQAAVIAHWEKAARRTEAVIAAVTPKPRIHPRN